MSVIEGLELLLVKVPMVYCLKLSFGEGLRFSCVEVCAERFFLLEACPFDFPVPALFGRESFFLLTFPFSVSFDVGAGFGYALGDRSFLKDLFLKGYLRMLEVQVCYVRGLHLEDIAHGEVGVFPESRTGFLGKYPVEGTAVGWKVRHVRMKI